MLKEPWRIIYVLSDLKQGSIFIFCSQRELEVKENLKRKENEASILDSVDVDGVRHGAMKILSLLLDDLEVDRSDS